MLAELTHIDAALADRNFIFQEMLIRWRHSKPTFTSKHENSKCEQLAKIELSQDKGHWVIAQIVPPIFNWEEVGFQTKISFPISTSEFKKNDLSNWNWCNKFFRESSMFDLNSLQLEIFYSSHICDPAAFFSVLEKCEINIVKFYVDAYGNGYFFLHIDR